ncbi:MAG: PaaI family thioesterase [Myxococcota bacterium]
MNSSTSSSGRDRGFEPKNPDYEARVRQSFDKQAFMHTVGAELARIEPGEVHIALPFSESLTQQHGFLHAGAISTVVDTACGYAALTLMPEDAAVLTVEFKVNLLSPGRGERFMAHGVVLKAGRTLMVSNGELRDAEDNTVASMTATMMVVRDRGLVG